jgi:hypothetical protein
MSIPHRARAPFAAIAIFVLAHCSGGGGTTKTTPPTYHIGGTVVGLVGTGLVLRNAAGEDLAVPALAKSFQFATPVASGGSYTVTVKTQPSNPAQTCTVGGGTGTMQSADVAVTVTCSTNGYAVGGAVTGLTAAGLVLHDSANAEDLPVAANATSYAFASSVASGTPYTVTIALQPPGLTCTVANATGTMGSSAVSNVDVSCTVVLVQRWTAPSTWGGLWSVSPTMVQHAWFDGTQIVEDPAANSGITWSVQNGAPPGQRELKAFPAGSRWGAGPFTGQRYQASGDVAVAALVHDFIACAVLKPDHDPAPGQERPIFAKGVTQGFNTVAGGGWALTQSLDSLGNGAFTFHYEYIAHLTGNTVHEGASVPTFFASETAGTNGQPSSVTVVPGGGPLTPSYVVFCGGREGRNLYSVVNGIALDYTVSAGHYAADTQLVGLAGLPPVDLDAGTAPHALTIGGYDTGDTTMVFGGRVYETAIWNEAGTPSNIQAKIAAIEGLAPGARYVRNREGAFYGPDAVAGTPAAGYHTAWNDNPRIDPVKGFLFGMQAWNRLTSYSFINTTPSKMYLYAAGEDLGLAPILGVVTPNPSTDPPGDTGGWTASGGASVAGAGTVAPPGDDDQQTAKLATLPPSSLLVAPIRPFDVAGPVQGQIWLQVPAATTGTLRIELGYSGLGGSDYFDVDLSSLPPGTWQRVWLYRDPGGYANSLIAGSGPSTVALKTPATNSGPVSFYAWGLQLTQIGMDPLVGASALTADLGAEMYDWSGAKDASNFGDPTTPIDALQLAQVPASTAGTGFCLSFDGTAPALVPWNAPFTSPRTALAWVDTPLAPTKSVQLYLSGATPPSTPGQICLSIPSGTPLCAPMPASFTAGSKHTVTGCASASGQLRLFVDGAANPIASGTAGAAPPDLSGGTLLVGGASVLPELQGQVAHGTPFHGYISKALICRDIGDRSSCQ